MAFHRYRAHLVVSRNTDIEENRWNGQNTKNDFPYFGVLGHEKHTYVGRILKKSLQSSIHSQFSVVIKGPFSQFLLQPCTVSTKQCRNKFSISRVAYQLRLNQTGMFESRNGHIPMGICGAGICSLQQWMWLYTLAYSLNYAFSSVLWSTGILAGICEWPQMPVGT